MKIVIIGGGTSGIAVATKLRRRNEKAEIVILEKSQEFAVAKCGLPYLLSEKIKDKDDIIAATPEQMWRIFNIKVKLEHEVIKINRKKHKLLINNRRTESYDKLIIATGATQLRPDIHGVLGENIFTINSIQSLERVKNYYIENNVKKVLIVGANATGLAFADAFLELGAKVIVTDANNHILPNFDTDMANILEQNINDNKLEFLIGSKITAFKNNMVNFENGDSCGFDMAIILTGSSPDLKLAITANLNVGDAGGIKTNKYMQTNDENIYACGKISEMLNLVTNQYERINNPAIETKQAKVIANHIAGIDTPLSGFMECSICKIKNWYAGICGASEQQLKQNNIEYKKIFLRQFCQSVFYPKTTPLYLKLMFNDDGTILGIQIIGTKGVAERINMVSVQMQHLGKVNDLMFANIGYYPEISQPKDALNNIGALAEEIRAGRLKYVTTETLDKDTFIIDVCSPDEFIPNNLPDAINLPLSAIRDNLISIPRNQKIAIYCNFGYGAYLAYQILRLNNFNNLYLLGN